VAEVNLVDKFRIRNLSTLVLEGFSSRALGFPCQANPLSWRRSSAGFVSAGYLDGIDKALARPLKNACERQTPSWASDGALAFQCMTLIALPFRCFFLGAAIPIDQPNNDPSLLVLPLFFFFFFYVPFRQIAN